MTEAASALIVGVFVMAVIAAFVFAVIFLSVLALAWVLDWRARKKAALQAAIDLAAKDGVDISKWRSPGNYAHNRYMDSIIPPPRQP